MDIFIGTVFLIICVLLIVVVLLQKGRGGGLGAAFGGAGSSAFGTRTGDVFTWITIVLTALFLLLAIVSSLALRPPPGTVAAPQFSIPGGEIVGLTPVTITSETREAKIAYTLDGSEPKKDDAKRNVTVNVKPGQTLRARAFRKDWIDSEIITEVYLPVTPASAPTSAPASAPTSQPNTTARSSIENPAFHLKSEARNSKYEIRNKRQIRNTNLEIRNKHQEANTNKSNTAPTERGAFVWHI